MIAKASLAAVALVALVLAGGRLATRPAPAPPAAAAPTTVAAAPPAWSFGTGAGQLGRGTTADGRPIAPASFLADASGLVVLDQENGRVVRGDGTSFPLPGKRADDLARAADGSFAVLDRLGAKDVASGRVRGRLPLEGPGLEDARAVTRVVVSGKDVYVERNGGGPLVRIGATDGTADGTRSEIPGVPTAEDDALVSAGVTSEDDGRAWVTVADRKGVHRWTRELRFPGEVSAVGFHGGAGGAVWVVLLAGATRAEYIDHAVCLDAATGAVRATVDLAVETPAWESFRDFAVKDDGSLVAARRSGDGVAYTPYACGAGS